MKKELQGAKVLLTGATGFVGSHLTKRLIAEGCEVHAIVRPGSDLSPLSEFRDSVKVHVHDSTLEGMFDVLANSSPDIVFHLASLFISEHQPGDIQPLVECNVHFGAQLLEAMRKYRVMNFVNTGTSWQHFEDQLYNPVNLYAATKQAFEDILAYYVEASDIRSITLELFDTYGPDDSRGKIVQLLMRIASSGEQLAMSPGGQLLDLVHIDDVVQAYVVAAERVMGAVGPKRQCYGVSSGEPVSLRKLASMMGELSGRHLAIEWGGRPYRKREVMKPWSKGETLPGWKPRVGLSEGVKSVLSSIHGV